MATREEIESLKTNWFCDPCWDIERTPGFDDHYDDLLAYRLKCEQEWRIETAKRRTSKMIELGIPDNPKLLNYIEHLEQRIEQLEQLLKGLAKI